MSAIRTVAETGSTNADVLALARAGADEGIWLRAERQTAGRGRRERAWASPTGNFYGSTLVRLRPSDPAAATLALVSGVALEEAVGLLPSPSPFPLGCAERAQCRVNDAPHRSGHTGGMADPTLLSRREGEGAPQARKGEGDRRLMLKWPNDLLIGGAKLAGILLERADDAVVVGIGVNLAHHPNIPDRPATSLAAHGLSIAPDTFADILAETFARWLARWRSEGLDPVRRRWIERAHPIGTALAARLADDSSVDGLFDGLAADGALILRLAGGERRVIHAGDVFLL